MFYYLLSNSTLIKKQTEKAKNLSILLFASLVYLVLHAFLSFNKSDLFVKIKTYFWVIIILDIVITYSNIKTSKNNIISDTNETNQITDNNSSEHNFVDKLFSIKNSITNLFLNNNNNDDKVLHDDIINEKNEIIKLLKDTLNSSENIKNKPHRELQEQPKEHFKINNENLKSTPIEKQNNINLLPTSISNQQSTPLNKIRNNITNITNITNKKNELPLNLNAENLNAENLNAENLNAENLNAENLHKENLHKENLNPEIENSNDNLFKDNASESGSDMDFDITDFQNTLDL